MTHAGPGGNAGGDDWLDDRLMTRAVEGLDPADEAELQTLLNVDDVDHGHYEAAAAYCWLGAGDPPSAMPADVAARPERSLAPPASGDARVGSLDGPGDRAAGTAAIPQGRIGAGLAAGITLLAVAGAWWAPADRESPSRAELVAARTELMANAPDAVRVEWEYAGAQEGAGASGYIVWSDARQSGYMTLRDIPTNETSASRYHAWLFPDDDTGGAPISVGAFNAPADGHEVIVPIRNPLPILQAEGFGIAREPPEQGAGSGRESLLLLAQPSADEN